MPKRRIQQIIEYLGLCPLLIVACLAGCSATGGGGMMSVGGIGFGDADMCNTLRARVERGDPQAEEIKQTMMQLGCPYQSIANLSSRPAPAPATPQALFGAAALGDVAAIQSLISQGVDVDARNPAGATPLIIAARGGHLQAVQTLLAIGADVNAVDTAGNSALSAATAAGSIDVVNALQAAGTHQAAP